MFRACARFLVRADDRTVPSHQLKRQQRIAYPAEAHDGSMRQPLNFSRPEGFETPLLESLTGRPGPHRRSRGSGMRVLTRR
jgi:hypothetical protein